MYVFYSQPQIDKTWNIYSSSILSQPNSFVISDLSPAQWYQIKVTAENAAGISTSIYSYATTSILGGELCCVFRKELSAVPDLNAEVNHTLELKPLKICFRNHWTPDGVDGSQYAGHRIQLGFIDHLLHSMHLHPSQKTQVS